MSEIVCICGSTKFRKEIEETNRIETMKGNIVLAPGVFAHSGDTITEKQKQGLDRLHCAKIDMSVRIIVVTVNNYIGESTRKEIEYAAQSGKLITVVNYNRPKTVVKSVSNHGHINLERGEYTISTNPVDAQMQICITKVGDWS